MAEDHFAGEVAEHYDADTADLSDPRVLEPMVRFLAELASGGAALELAIGTGRVAIPLAAAGVAVSGIEFSPDMVAQLRAKRGGSDIAVTVGDMAAATMPGSFRLVYLVFNTIENLTSQDAQVACFCNAAAHLEPGGCFVVEVEVPQLRRLPPGETVRPFEVTAAHLGFDEFDPVNQGLVSHHYTFGDGGVRTLSVPFRYVWPGELDLMARIAGMRLRERWGGWNREPFTADSWKHVSVREKA